MGEERSAGVSPAVFSSAPATTGPQQRPPATSAVPSARIVRRSGVSEPAVLRSMAVGVWEARDAQGRPVTLHDGDRLAIENLPHGHYVGVAHDERGHG